DGVGPRRRAVLVADDERRRRGKSGSDVRSDRVLVRPRVRARDPRPRLASARHAVDRHRRGRRRAARAGRRRRRERRSAGGRRLRRLRDGGIGLGARYGPRGVARDGWGAASAASAATTPTTPTTIVVTEGDSPRAHSGKTAWYVNCNRPSMHRYLLFFLVGTS